ncbi:uncharacterized protein LOC135818433 [Sycon ciliatum]|uniref:uncharacterized protein LOC135818433 n=1 Tax=Sycon ciliatum TaxID=27933 RepID=UPI0031F6056C
MDRVVSGMGKGKANAPVRLDCDNRQARRLSSSVRWPGRLLLTYLLLVALHWPATGMAALQCSQCSNCTLPQEIVRNHVCPTAGSLCTAVVDLTARTSDGETDLSWTLTELGCAGGGGGALPVRCDIQLNGSSVADDMLTCQDSACTPSALSAETMLALRAGQTQLRVCCASDNCNERLALEMLALGQAANTILQIHANAAPTIVIRRESRFTIKTLYICLATVSGVLLLMVLFFTAYIWYDGQRRVRHRRKGRMGLERKPSTAASERVVIRQRSCSPQATFSRGSPVRTHLCTHNHGTSRQSSFRRSTVTVDRTSRLLAESVATLTHESSSPDSTTAHYQAAAAHAQSSNGRPVSIVSVQPSQQLTAANYQQSSNGVQERLPSPPSPIMIASTSTAADSASSAQISHSRPPPQLHIDNSYMTPNGHSAAETPESISVDVKQRRTISLSRKRTPTAHRLTRDMNGEAVPVKMASLSVASQAEQNNSFNNPTVDNPEEPEKRPSTVSDKLRRLGFDHIPSLDQVCQSQQNGRDASSPELSDVVSEEDHPATQPTCSVSTFSAKPNGHCPPASSTFSNHHAELPDMERRRRKRNLADASMTVV